MLNFNWAISFTCVLFFTPQVTFGDDCDSVLYEGVFGGENYNNVSKRADVVSEYFESGKANEYVRSKGGGFKIGIPIEGVPLNLEFDGSAPSQRKMNDLLKKKYFHDRSEYELSHVVKQFADKELLRTWLECKRLKANAQPGKVWGEIVSADHKHALIDIHYRPAVEGDSLPKIDRIAIIGGRQRDDAQAPALKVGDFIPFQGSSLTVDRTSGEGLTVFLVTSRGKVTIIEAPVLENEAKELTHFGSMKVERISDLAFPIGDTDSLWKLYEEWIESLPKNPEVKHPMLEANRAVMRVLAHWCKEEAEVELSRMRAREDPNAERMTRQFEANLRSFVDATAPILDFGNYTTNDRANIKIDGAPRKLDERNLDRIYGRMQERFFPFGLIDR